MRPVLSGRWGRDAAPAVLGFMAVPRGNLMSNSCALNERRRGGRERERERERERLSSITYLVWKRLWRAREREETNVDIRLYFNLIYNNLTDSSSSSSDPMLGKFT
ncbi:hypothetical protein KSP39_PZI011781 [Platanthera zijinensis]|uniref:Uncharacterized protein n=1 Tax=Platanthera zijinensis TaxID=2320716 RepID=A0AAP0BF34_9ASPA